MIYIYTMDQHCQHLDEEGLRARTEAREELDAELEKLRLEKLKAVMASEEAKEALNQAVFAGLY